MENRITGLIEDAAGLIAGLEALEKELYVLKEKNDELRCINAELTSEVNFLREVDRENVMLREKIEYAKENSTALAKIESLEFVLDSAIANLKARTSELSALKLREVAMAAKIADANRVKDSFEKIAVKLSIKAGGRSLESLIAAVDDSVRKLS